MPRFPLAEIGEWERTSDDSDRYNCVAWAAGDTSANWWPEPDAPEYYWPPGALRDGSLEAFESGLTTLGFQRCDAWDFEPGYEKLAVYASSVGSPRHVAGQLPDGSWTSKLGDEEDIRHLTPRALEGSIYGNVVLVMRRRAAEV